MEEDPLKGPDDDPSAREVIIIIAIFFEAGLAPFSILLGWLLGHKPLQAFTWSLSDALWGVAAAVPLLAMFLTILTWPIGPLARAKRFCENEVAPLFENSTWSDIALYSLSAGVGEEMLFRGVFQESLIQWSGLPWGLVLTGLLFGLCHPVSWSYMAIYACLGIYFGGVLLFNGNLLSAMVTHVVFGFAALCYLIQLQHWDDGQSGTD